MESNTIVVGGSVCTTTDSIVLVGYKDVTTNDFVYTPYLNYGKNNPNTLGYNTVNMWATNTLHGTYNVMVGYNSGCNTTSGNYNYYIGWDVGYPQKTKEELKRESRKDKLTEIFGDDI